MDSRATIGGYDSLERKTSQQLKKCTKGNKNPNNESTENKAWKTQEADNAIVIADQTALRHGNTGNTQSDEVSSTRELRQSRKGGLNQGLREWVKSKYQPKAVNLMVRYNKLGAQFAEFSNNVAFLGRCANMMVVPKTHRVYNDHVRNTRAVVRLLDQCSYQVMIADLEHNHRRKVQVKKNRERIESRLAEMMSPEDFEEVRKICDENREVYFADMKERQRKEYQDLLDEYKAHETKKKRKRQNLQRTDAESNVSVGPGIQSGYKYGLSSVAGGQQIKEDVGKGPSHKRGADVKIAAGGTDCAAEHSKNKPIAKGDEMPLKNESSARDSAATSKNTSATAIVAAGQESAETYASHDRRDDPGVMEGGQQIKEDKAGKGGLAKQGADGKAGSTEGVVTHLKGKPLAKSDEKSHKDGTPAKKTTATSKNSSAVQKKVTALVAGQEASETPEDVDKAEKDVSR
ncbi:hypothetical protein BIW11_05664 [Tropilaelaps mercedesae]|uniref:Uncharacterized protein n=1 Tax=Tropilaelaps mercedesae TaxID=418985 RepID=A0A1V9Y1D8_9ACAR|nr:hypothetical protein BIW11_05664 [Tropilaelaps mercedesae]